MSTPGWITYGAETYVAIIDERNYVHLPLDEQGDVAVCGITGRREDRPANWASVFCTTCLRDCVPPSVSVAAERELT